MRVWEKDPLSWPGQDKETLHRRKTLGIIQESKMIRRQRMEPKETPTQKDKSRGMCEGQWEGAVRNVGGK